MDAAPAETPRFRVKRSLILDAAAALINERGVKGLALADVAETVGLSTTSVTYYFKRKEQLATACFERALDALEAMIATAETEADPRARVRRLTALSFAALSAVERGEDAAVARLLDIRVMDEPARGLLIERYEALFRRVRRFFGPDDDPAVRPLANARAQLLLENLFWVPAWLDRYAPEEHGRVEARMLELFEQGLAPGGAVWPARPLAIADEPGEAGRRSFLAAATRLISERGYRGASVERIASELNVTKGSFYHHLDAKDDLVLACFQRSFATIARAQEAAIAAGGDGLRQLVAVLAALLEIQFGPRGPLLRSTAFLALPADLRRQMFDRSNRIARRFAGIIIDGISAGELPARDPLVASQMLMATINGAFELRRWAETVPLDEAIRLYGDVLLDGLFAD